MTPVLTIRQPWAEAIRRGAKRVENRTWAPPPSLVGQRILIHAGKRRPSGPDLEAAARLGVEARDAPREAIVASARIARVVTSPDELPPDQR